MKLSVTAEFPGASFRFARYILAMGVFLMPFLGVVDYVNAYYAPALVKFITFFICLTGFILSKNSDYEQIVCLGAAGVILVMSLTGAAFKLDSSYSILWVAVLPAMFCFLSGLTIGIILSAVYLLGYTFFYATFQSFQDRPPVAFEIWMHSVLVYLCILSVSVMFKSEKQKDERFLKNVAERDYLTNVLNRRGFVPFMMHELKRAERYQFDVSLILFDVDFFKKVNDQFGHDEGDKLLVKLMKIVLPQIRDSDNIARWGGEEFIILTPQTDLESAVELAEKLRKCIAEHDFPNIGNITASFGVAQYQKGETWDSFVKKADENLYRAKSSGRNCVVHEF